MNKGIWIALVLMMTAAGCASTEPVVKEAPMPAGAERMDKDCESPLGRIKDGGSAMGYLQPVAHRGQTCEQGTLSCVNGVWSGAYIHPSCTRIAQ